MNLSVITLTYNNKDELFETLQSVPASDFIEHIIVNGGRDPYSRDILHGRRGKIINEKDSGIADAFNKGISASTSETVIFLNSGDILLDKEYFHKARRILETEKDISFIHSNILFIDELGGNLIVKPPMGNIGRGMKYLHPSVIMRKEIFEKIGMFDTSYRIAMDYDLMARAEKHGLSGFYINDTPVVRMSGGGKSQSQEYAAIKECLTSLQKNNLLNLKTFSGVSVRITLFYLRKLLAAAGGKNILGRLKRIKYSAVI